MACVMSSSSKSFVRALLLFTALLAVVIGGSGCSGDNWGEEEGQNLSLIERTYFDALETARNEGKEARDEKLALGESLGAELSKVQSAMSPEDVKRYTVSFHKRPSSVETTKKHADSMGAVADALLKDGSRGGDVKLELLGYTKERKNNETNRAAAINALSKKCATAIYESLVLLANADAEILESADVGVLHFARDVLRDKSFSAPNGGEAAAITGTYREIAKLGSGVTGDDELNKRIEADILIPLLAKRTIRMLGEKADGGANYEPTPADVEEILEPLSEAPHFFEGIPIAKAGVQKLLTARGPSMRDAYLNTNLGVPNKFLASVQVVSVIANLWMAKNAWQEGDYAMALQNVVHAIPHMAESLAAIAKLTNTRLLNAAMLGRLSMRLEPIIGLAVTALETYEAWKEFKDESNIGTGLAVGGGLVSCAGFALMLFPATAPVGVIVLAAGTAIRFIGELLAGRIEGAEMREQVETTLKEIGYEEALIKTLLDAEEERVTEMVQELHLMPSQVKLIAQRYPRFVTQDSHHGYAIEALKDIKKVFQPTSAPAPATGEGFNMVDFMAAIDPAGGDDGAMMLFCFTVLPLRFPGYPGGQATKQAWVSALRNTTNTSGYTPEAQAGFARAANYLARF